jgi:zinc transport system substrate-binding protein
MVEPGANPATYEPKPEQVRGLSRVVAHFIIGVPFQNAWLPRIAEPNPDMMMVDTIASIKGMPTALHRHGAGLREGRRLKGGEGVPDPHVWLSLALVKVHSQVVQQWLQLSDLRRRRPRICRAGARADGADSKRDRTSGR